LILLILPLENVPLVLAHIQIKFKSSDCFYWVIPTITSGYASQGALTNETRDRDQPHLLGKAIRLLCLGCCMMMTLSYPRNPN
jgi:hypothetical protein